MKWKKRLVSLVLALCMFVGVLPTASLAEENGGASKEARYTVLVLDTSATSRFKGSNGQILYTADSAIDYVKQAAKKFLTNLNKNTSRKNYISIVSYTKEAEIVTDFTTDTKSAINSIDELKASSETRSIYEGLSAANELLSNISDGKATKNVILVTTGMTNIGEYNYSGHYDETTIGSGWKNSGTNVRLYAYANAAYNMAEDVKEKANIYTLGMFQTMKNIPEEGSDVAEFFKLTAKDLATSEDYFYEVTDIDALDAYFDRINKDIEIIDSMSIPATADHYLSYYGDAYKEPSKEEEIKDAFNMWANALNDYYMTLHGSVQSEANTDNNTLSLREQDQANKQPVLTIDSLADDRQINAAYAGLAEFYNQFEGGTPSIGKIDLSASMISIESKITEAIEQSYKAYNFNINYNGYIVTVNAQIMFDSFTGSIRVTKRNQSITFTINSDGETAAHTMALYLKTLNEAAEEVTKDGLRAYLKEFGRVTCISQFAQDEFTNAIGEIYDYMDSKGYGKLTKYAVKIYKGYKLGKSLSNIYGQKSLEEKLNNAEELYKQVKDLKVTDSSVKQQFTKEALKEVEKRRSTLENMLYNYIYHRDENLSYERLWFEKVGDWINNGFKKLGFKCPVTITVYDENGNQIGFAEDGYCEYDDSIYIEVDGDIKTIYVPKDMNVSVHMTGTDTGAMNYTIEDFKELGKPIGRMNYYDIPLTEGGIYTQNITAGELSTDTTTLPIIGGNGESICADEYISSNDSAVCNVSCNMSEGGVVIGTGQYARGDDIQLSAYANEGYYFAGWYYNNKLVGLDTTYHATARENMTVQALFRPVLKEQKITCDYEDNFSKSLKESSFNLNAKTTGDGYLNYYTDYTGVLNISTDGTVTLNNAGTAEIYIVASETDTCDKEIKTLTITVIDSSKSLPFVDVSENDWFAPCVQFVYDNGLMTGTSKTTFEPGTTLNRAMVAQVLYNYDKRVDSPYRSTNGIQFKDVSKNDWYYEAIQWASANGIASGVGNGYFEPNKPVTREQVAQFLYNYNGRPNVSGNLPFSDANRVSSWAKNAMLWAYQNNIINGTTSPDGGLLLDPQGGATRAQAAAILMNYMKNMM